MNKSKKHKMKRNSIRNANLSSKEDSILLSSAKIASSKAVRSSMALGITIKVIKNHEIIEISPDYSEKVLRKIAKPTIDLSTLKKGMILNRNHD